MSREDLIRQIQALSDEELKRIGPFLESDLALLSEPDVLVRDERLEEEVRRGLLSAREGPLVDDREVQELLRKRRLGSK